MTQAECSHQLHQSEKIMPRIIKTTRLVLRPVHSLEAAELHALFTNEEVRRYLTDGAVMSRGWVEGVIRDSEASFTERGLGLWSAREHGAIPIIGLTGFRDFYDPPVCELLYVLQPAHWHCGFATEMARAAIDYAFTHTRLTEVRASTDEPNQASIRVMERLGMRSHGHTSMADSQRICWDQLHFILSRDDWKASD
jgi:ribosomal-protein-alanine N-acetyltransferase